ncbi:MAG: DUF5074 domain-containing protein [Bacteroidales bacterium]
MKKVYSLILLLFVLCLQAFAQTNSFQVQGVPRPDLKNSGTPVVRSMATKTDMSFTMDDIQNWTGTGSKRAALVIQWNDEKNPDALVWGYKWDGEATGADMLTAIVTADPNLFALVMKGTQFGMTLGGLGYDLNGQNPQTLTNAGTEQQILNGFAETSSYDFDNWSCTDKQDHWASGWMKAYWTYCVREKQTDPFNYSSQGVSNRTLSDGSWDAFWFNKDMSMNVTFASTFTPAPALAPARDYSKGVFILNEDWFGHSNGTINYLDENSEFSYRVYQYENGDTEQLGVTTQYGTVYGDRMYIISKQGTRIVVADAKTMKKIASVENISADGKSGDGRAFIGVNETTGYVSTSNGIFLMNLETNQVTAHIAGTEGQTGNMVQTNDYVFAVQPKKILVIKDNALHSTIEGDSYSSLCLSKDGHVWVAAKTKLIKINPADLSGEDVVLPTGITLHDSWGAWNAGGFCASAKTNSLYWSLGGTYGGGTKVYRFDIDNPSSINNEPVYTLPGKQIFYGAGIRVHPQTGELYIITTQDGFGSNFEHNWVHRVNGETGEQIEMLKLDQYYWFQALPVFPDAEMPLASSLDKITISGANDAAAVKWEDLISDKDNTTASITKRVVSNSHPQDLSVSMDKDHLILSRISGNERMAQLELAFNSNGKTVHKTLSVELSNAVGLDTENETPKAYRSGNRIHALESGSVVEFYTLSGVLIKRRTAHSSVMDIPADTYVIVRILTQHGVQILK